MEMPELVMDEKDLERLPTQVRREALSLAEVEAEANSAVSKEPQDKAPPQVEAPPKEPEAQPEPPSDPPSEVAPEEPPSEVAPEEPPPEAAPKEPAPAPDPVANLKQELAKSKQRYSCIKGKYDKEGKRLRGENKEFSAQLESQRTEIAELQAKVAARVETSPQDASNGSGSTMVDLPPELQELGPEVARLAEIKAQQVFDQQFQKLQQENLAPVLDRLGKQQAMMFDSEMDRLVPGLERIYMSEEFHEWLDAPDPRHGGLSSRMSLDEAEKQGDAMSAAGIFNAFKETHPSAASVPQAPAPTPTPAPAPAPAAPSAQASSVASQVTPSGGPARREEKQEKIYTKEEYLAIVSRVARDSRLTQEKKDAQLEILEKAFKEGRVK